MSHYHLWVSNYIVKLEFSSFFSSIARTSCYVTNITHCVLSKRCPRTSLEILQAAFEIYNATSCSPGSPHYALKITKLKLGLLGSETWAFANKIPLTDVVYFGMCFASAVFELDEDRLHCILQSYPSVSRTARETEANRSTESSSEGTEVLTNWGTCWNWKPGSKRVDNTAQNQHVPTQLPPEKWRLNAIRCTNYSSISDGTLFLDLRSKFGAAQPA